MANFCTNCGKSLPENGVCDCRTNTAEAGAAPAATAVAENAYVKQTKQAVGQFMPFVKTYFADPGGATMAALREKNLALALIMMLVSAVSAGLFLLTALNKTFGSLGKLMKEMIGKVDISVPFFPSFFGGFAIALVVLAVSVLGLFLLLKLLKINASMQYVLIAVGVNSVLCAGFTLLAWLLMLVGLTKVSAVVLLLGGVFWCVLGVLLATKVFGAKFTSVLALLYTAVFAVALALSLWLGAKLTVGAIGTVEIEDEKISDAIEELQDNLKDLDLEDILNSVSGSFFY